MHKTSYPTPPVLDMSTGFSLNLGLPPTGLPEVQKATLMEPPKPDATLGLPIPGTLEDTSPVEPVVPPAIVAPAPETEIASVELPVGTPPVSPADSLAESIEDTEAADSPRAEVADSPRAEPVPEAKVTFAPEPEVVHFDGGLPPMAISSPATDLVVEAPASDAVPLQLQSVPGGMYLDDDGSWRRNLPVTRPTEIQKSSIVNASLLTASGFSYQEAKSALQKAVRRARPSEAAMWAFEMFSTPLASTAAKTNVTNRLLVMAIEDIGPAQPWAILACHTLMDQIWKQKEPPADQEMQCVLNMATFLASPELERTRCADMLCHVSDPKLHSPPVANAVVVETYGGNIETVKAALVEAIRTKNTEQMVYLIDVLSFTDIKLASGKGRGGRTKAHYLIPEAFNEALPGNLYVSIVIQLHSRLGASARLLYANICLLHLHDKLPTGDWPEYLTQTGPSGLFEPGFSTYTLEQLNLAYIDGVPRYGVPEYALDKHTATGSKGLGRGIPHFYGIGAIESPSYIENEAGGIWKQTSDYLMGIIRGRDLDV